MVAHPECIPEVEQQADSLRQILLSWKPAEEDHTGEHLHPHSGCPLITDHQHSSPTSILSFQSPGGQHSEDGA